ncbi:hypothetical protein [Brevundimonas vesicularis]
MTKPSWVLAPADDPADDWIGSQATFVLPGFRMAAAIKRRRVANL